MHNFLCPQVPVSGTCSLVLLPCFPSIGVSVPLRLPKSTRQIKREKYAIFFVIRRRSQASRSPVLLPCFPSIGVPVPLRLPKSIHQKKKGKNARFSLSSDAVLRYLVTGLAALSTQYWGPCPFKASKKHLPKKKREKSAIFFVLRCRSQAPAHRPYCPVFLVLRSLSL